MPEVDFSKYKKKEYSFVDDILDESKSIPKPKKSPAKKKGQKIEVKIDKNNDPPEVIIEGSKTASKNLQNLITKDTAIIDLIQEVKDLKEKVAELEEKKIDLPDEVYKGLWIMSKAFQSQYRKKSDSMLGHLGNVMTHFNIDLTKNPFDNLKQARGSE